MGDSSKSKRKLGFQIVDLKRAYAEKLLSWGRDDNGIHDEGEEVLDLGFGNTHEEENC